MEKLALFFHRRSTGTSPAAAWADPCSSPSSLHRDKPGVGVSAHCHCAGREVKSAFFRLRQSAQRSSLHIWQNRQSGQLCFRGRDSSVSITKKRPRLPGIRTNGMVCGSLCGLDCFLCTYWYDKGEAPWFHRVSKHIADLPEKKRCSPRENGLRGRSTVAMAMCTAKAQTCCFHPQFGHCRSIAV